MQQINFPTNIFYGPGSSNAMIENIAANGIKKLLIVSDTTLEKIGLVQQLRDLCRKQGLEVVSYCESHPNPIEEDVINGLQAYQANNCQAILALGGGSPIDVAKTILILVNNPQPLAQYDDAKGGDKLITKPLPPLYAIPTTAGTGSEVGRASVIILKDTGDKTIFFHPSMMPKMAALEPEYTAGLPANITAATGIDAFTHSLEAYLAPGFHPMADGIALEAIKLILDNLPLAYQNGNDLDARGKMLMAATMGATAFQKGLGMIHSMAHPLSSECGLHHGLANALVLPYCLEFMEESNLSDAQRMRLEAIQNIFAARCVSRKNLSDSCRSFISSLGIEFGLANYNVKNSQIELLSKKAFQDTCHMTNMIKVTERDFFNVFQRSI